MREGCPHHMGRLITAALAVFAFCVSAGAAHR
jgi:hypothetical protein